MAALVSWGLVRDVFDAYCRRRGLFGDQRFDVDFFDFYSHLVMPRKRPPAGVGVKRVRVWRETLRTLQTRTGRNALERQWDHIVVEDEGTEPSRTSPTSVKVAVILGWGEGQTTVVQTSQVFEPGAEVGTARLASVYRGLSGVLHKTLRRNTIVELRRLREYSGEPSVLDKVAGVVSDVLEEIEITNDERHCLVTAVQRSRAMYSEETEASGWR